MHPSHSQSRGPRVCHSSCGRILYAASPLKFQPCFYGDFSLNVTIVTV